MTSRVWLRANSRPALLLALPALLLGGLLVALALSGVGQRMALLLAGGMAAVAGLTALFVFTRPRIERVGDQLKLRVRWLGAESAPLAAVEGFLLGTGELPVAIGGRPVENATLVVKLADSALEWADRPTNRALAQWCDHYVRIRGVFCEPLDLALVAALNERLAETRREEVSL